MVVTFNGSSFDLPKLKKELQMMIGMSHINLKPLCVNLGLKRGLKDIENLKAVMEFVYKKMREKVYKLPSLPEKHG